LLAKAKLTGQLYPETRAELKRDQQWLKSLGKTDPAKEQYRFLSRLGLSEGFQPLLISL